MEEQQRVYLAYLNQARASGLPPDGRRWDYPCPQFEKAAAELVRLGLARRRWLLFGPLGITRRGMMFRRMRSWIRKEEPVS
jgi:hypothetical protein